MKVILDIHFNGKNINDIFKLPCVKSVTKDKNDKPEVLLKRESTNGRLIAHIGDHICQYESGLWQVYGSEAADKIIKGGKYAHE